MILNINENIGKESFDKIVSAYNTLKEGESLEVYLCTGGGEIAELEAIVHFLSTNDRVSLVGYGELCSAGFDIFFRSTCTKKLLPGTMGMAHFTGVIVNFLDEKRPRKVDDKAYMEWTRKSKLDCISLYTKLGFTKKELEQIKKGNDVWFQYDRMLSFLKNAEHNTNTDKQSE
jgi:hypothetical protein